MKYGYDGLGHSLNTVIRRLYWRKSFLYEVCRHRSMAVLSTRLKLGGYEFVCKTDLSGFRVVVGMGKVVWVRGLAEPGGV